GSVAAAPVGDKGLRQPGEDGAGSQGGGDGRLRPPAVRAGVGEGGGRRADREAGAGAKPEVDRDRVALEETGGCPDEDELRPVGRGENLGGDGGPGFEHDDPVAVDNDRDAAPHRATPVRRGQGRKPRTRDNRTFWALAS